MPTKKSKKKKLPYRLTLTLTDEDIKLLSAVQHKEQARSTKSISWAKLLRQGLVALAEKEGVNGRITE